MLHKYRLHNSNKCVCFQSNRTKYETSVCSSIAEVFSSMTGSRGGTFIVEALSVDFFSGKNFSVGRKNYG